MSKFGKRFLQYCYSSYGRLMTIRFRKLTSRILNRLEVLVSHMAGSHCCLPSVMRDLEKFWWSNYRNSRWHRENAPLHYLHYLLSLYCWPLPPSRSSNSNFKAWASPVQWNISKTSVLVQMQFLTMKLFLVSIQLIFCFSNPLCLISVSLWMRWSCSCITVFVNLYLLTCKYISAPWTCNITDMRAWAVATGYWCPVDSECGIILSLCTLGLEIREQKTFVTTWRVRGGCFVWWARQGCWMRMQSPCTSTTNSSLVWACWDQKHVRVTVYESCESIYSRYWPFPESKLDNLASGWQNEPVLKWCCYWPSFKELKQGIYSWGGSLWPAEQNNVICTNLILRCWNFG